MCDHVFNVALCEVALAWDFYLSAVYSRLIACLSCYAGDGACFSFVSVILPGHHFVCT